MEVRIALDTNRLTDLLRGDDELVEFLELCDEVWVPLIVLGEIRAGFQGGRKPHHNELLLRRFLSEPTVNVLLPGEATADHYARLFVQLRRAGTPIPDNDIWIASMALEHNLAMVTRDQHFEKIPQLIRM